MSNAVKLVRENDPELALAMDGVETHVAANRDPKALFDGTLLKKLIAYIQANPGKALALVQWILLMFGITIPIPSLDPATAK